MDGYIAVAQAAVAKSVKLQPGYAITWAEQHANLQHAKEKLFWVIPLTLLLVVGLLYLNFRHGGKVMLVLMCLPFSLSGGIWLVYLLDYHRSVAVAVGFIALAGVAAEFGVVMLLYLDHALAELRQSGQPVNR